MLLRNGFELGAYFRWDIHRRFVFCGWLFHEGIVPYFYLHCQTLPPSRPERNASSILTAEAGGFTRRIDNRSTQTLRLLFVFVDELTVLHRVLLLQAQPMLNFIGHFAM